MNWIKLTPETRPEKFPCLARNEANWWRCPNEKDLYSATHFAYVELPKPELAPCPACNSRVLLRYFEPHNMNQEVKCRNSEGDCGYILRANTTEQATALHNAIPRKETK